VRSPAPAIPPSGGEIHLAAGRSAEAEADFQAALREARRMEFRSELRTATDLARHWQAQGRIPEARGLLEPIYRWFTQGLETPILRSAQAVLEKLE